MDEALNHVFGALPGSTKVYCGHEYTVSNLLFAQSVEPDNLQVQEKLIWAQQRRDNGLSTVPSTLEEEWSYNPFMRVRVPGIQKRVGQDEPVPVMKALRELKNDFRPPVV
jgi:hydroxyacylglutathione hydrolase